MIQLPLGGELRLVHHHFSSSVFVVVVVVWGILSTTSYVTAEDATASSPAYTNPYYNGGCLKNVLPNWNRKRICNSQDPLPEAQELGYCRESSLPYTEVRLGSGTWETAFVNDWLLQVLLSEFLDVPVSLEGGSPETNFNLYHPDSAFDFWITEYDRSHQGLGVATRVGDCRELAKNKQDAPYYEQCYHLHPEVWWQSTNQSSVPQLGGIWDLGVLSELAIYVPKFAAQMDSSIVSYLGLAGPENRRKLAETFKTPTRWGMYCRDFSPTNCTYPSPIAARAPQNAKEEMAFHQEGVFAGYFRRVEGSNCAKFPSRCAGDFINAPCGWGSYAKQQLYHNNIALEMRGPNVDGSYTYGEQLQIWRAALLTKSPVMGLFFSTDPPYEEFRPTQAQMTRVLFPPQTQECLDARIDSLKRCDADATFLDWYGAPEGACDSKLEPLKKLISNGFGDITIGESIPDAFKSPAYDAVQNYHITELDYQEIYDRWYQIANGTNPDGYHLREATCQFVAHHLDRFESFVPPTHPRVVVESDSSQTKGLTTAALCIAIVALVLVLLALGVAVRKRKAKVLYYLQLEFWTLLLGGMLLVAVGSVLLASPVHDWTCILIAWTINIGFVLQLVPLYARISAISALATSGKQMQRVQLETNRLLAEVAIVAGLVAVFLLVWGLVDAPQSTHEYEITDQQSVPEGETIIMAYEYCGSEHSQWVFASFAWQALLLVPSCMIAFLALRVKEDMNDTRAMSTLLGVHLFFLCLQVITSAMMHGKSDWMRYSSIIWSADIIIGKLGLYLLPKFLDSGEDVEEEEDPLPDVFVHTTIAMIDVQGFTAWTSVREPIAVFQFLEQLYEHLDKLAEKHGVYKVETTGDTYVAATGIPNAQSNHCLVMASFAIDVMRKMPMYVRRQEIKFGPDTSNLTLRIGMHSGPVTGGFLKGKGSRFQVFGDTSMVASLIHSHSMSNRIQLSQASADLLIKANKRTWVMEREEGVKTLEKGNLKTYWLVKGFRREYGIEDRNSIHEGSIIGSDDADYQDIQFTRSMDSEDRWVEFNVETFKGLLKQIIAQRGSKAIAQSLNASKRFSNSNPSFPSDDLPLAVDMPLEEVQEVIHLPRYDKKKARRQLDTSKTEIPDDVIGQLREYIKEIAMQYNDNPFHNFAHASYVVMAVIKYMNRIKAASEADTEGMSDESVLAVRHFHTYGITSDPITSFACVFSALIHDADHPGVPNPQLILEDKEVAERYKERSVAEQKSLDIAWDLLMEERFEDLLSTICSTPEELKRFRSLVVNSVMATDLGDKQLKELRNGRWEKAFSLDDESYHTDPSLGSNPDLGGDEEEREQINRKATIVIEHLIQAADVAHMSQHWNIYRQWNERLFRETYKAYRDGRAEKNPADGWYKGEIGFFDFYIIPLSKKLRDCGVFGPTSDENLNYATNNRNQWVEEGEELVKEMLQRAQEEYPQPETHPVDLEP